MPFMGYFLLFAFLFMLGCSFGWVLEVFYRRFISSSNPERRWINPGFLTGPALPLYGTGVCAMWLIVSLEPFIPITDVSLRRAVLFLGITLGMTLIEYIAGLLSTRVFKVQLWDYSRRWGNIQGIICPLFTLFWGILGITYYYLVHPLLNRSLHWLMEDTNVVAAYAFCMGMYYGILLLDLIHSSRMLGRIRKFARENQIIVRYEDLRERIRRRKISERIKLSFLFDMWSEHPLVVHLQEYLQDVREKLKQDAQEKLRQLKGEEKDN